MVLHHGEIVGHLDDQQAIGAQQLRHTGQQLPWLEQMLQHIVQNHQVICGIGVHRLFDQFFNVAT